MPGEIGKREKWQFGYFFRIEYLLTEKIDLLIYRISKQFLSLLQQAIYDYGKSKRTFNNLLFPTSI